MRRAVLLITVFITLSSCQVIDKLFKGDVIARVGTNVLYESEIIPLIPNNSTPEDSARVIEQYIYSWATQQLLLSQAERQLPKEDRNVDKELDDFRRTLLVYRYEKLFVDQRLDTLITEDECEAYYKNNPQIFVTNSSVLRARYIKISNASPNLQQIKSLYRSSDVDDSLMLNDLCYSSAEKFYDFNGEYIPLEYISKELEEDLVSCEAAIAKSDFIEMDRDGFFHLVSVSDRIKPGEVAPYEFCRAKIEEIILSRRKQELLSSLERNLLNDAISSDLLKIYNNE